LPVACWAATPEWVSFCATGICGSSERMFLPVHDILWKAFHEPHLFHQRPAPLAMCSLLWETQTLPPEDLLVCIKSIDDLLLTTGVQTCMACQAKGTAWLVLATDGRWPTRHAVYSDRYRRLVLKTGGPRIPPRLHARIAGRDDPRMGWTGVCTGISACVGSMNKAHHPQCRFILGRLLITPGAIAALTEGGHSPLEFLSRHASGDWGEVCHEDKAANDQAVHEGERMLSAYRTNKGERIDQRR